MNETQEQLEIFWRNHVTEFSRSGLTGRAYCQEHGLKDYQLGYWKRRFARGRESVKDLENGSGFVQMKVKGNGKVSSDVSLHLKGGICLELSELPEVRWLGDLWKALSLSETGRD